MPTAVPTVYETATGNNAATDVQAYITDPSRNNTVMSVTVIPFSDFWPEQETYTPYWNGAGEFISQPTLAVSGGSLSTGADFTGLPAFLRAGLPTVAHSVLQIGLPAGQTLPPTKQHTRVKKPPEA